MTPKELALQWYEIAKANDRHHFEEYWEGETLHCAYSFRLFFEAPIVQAGLAAFFSVHHDALASSLQEATRQARLEEAKWWHDRARMDHAKDQCHSVAGR